jgi:hypothetical protein
MLRHSLIACLGTLMTVGHASAAPYGQVEQGNDCKNVTMFRRGDIDSLPLSTSALLREAVQPSLQAIVSDKAMGLEGTDTRRVPLKAVLIGAVAQHHVLYMVSWEDSSFGVNGAIWIVELAGEGARNLVPVENKRSPGFALGGFGFSVLASSSSAYPEIVIASSGFKDGGGAEAEGRGHMCSQRDTILRDDGVSGRLQRGA